MIFKASFFGVERVPEFSPNIIKSKEKNIDKKEKPKTSNSDLKKKTNDELKRLTKVSVSFQKQLSTFSPKKTYAKVVDDHPRESIMCENVCYDEEADQPIRHHSRSDLLDNTVAAKIQSLRNEMPKSPMQIQSAEETTVSSPSAAGVSSFSAETLRCTSPNPSEHNGDGENSIELPDANSSRPKRQRNVNTGRIETDNAIRSVKYNGESCKVTIKDHQLSSKADQEDIFIGVTYKRTARYYLSGINKKSTEYGIENYIRNKGVKTTHLMLFKPRYRKSLVTAKVNVPAEFAKTVESPHFWPEGVKCRRWLSNRDWEQKCAMQPTQERWESEHDCD